MVKPRQVLIVEKECGISLVLIDKNYDIFDFRNICRYELDESENIISLNLSGSNITDLSILKIFDRLIALDLSNCRIGEMSVLQSLPNLTRLSLTNSKSLDKLLVRRLTQLSYLALDSCGITDPDFLINLNKLTYLSLNNNKISDASQLINLRQLVYLSLNNNSISDISFLKGLRKLSNLNLSRNQISDISSSNQLRHLKNLELRYNKIVDISALNALKELESLNLSNNLISGKYNLSGLNNLKELDLSNNKIANINFIEELPALKYLNLSRNSISDISLLRKFNQIKSLELTGTKIRDITILKDSMELDYLGLGNNKITDISFLKNFSKIKQLQLSNNYISDISPLKNMSKLFILDLDYNEISNLDPIKNLIELEVLYLGNNKIIDITCIKNLFKISMLDLSRNQIKDIRPLIGLIQRGINVSDNFIDGVNLKENPLEYPPLEIFKEGNDAILKFFEKVDKEGTDSIFEAKVTLVGEGSAGKTSLLKRLLDSKSKLPQEKNRTRGISIADWEFKKQKNRKHIAHIWDFGGQDVYYPVHRFFLTENSVFVLLASSRQNTHNFDYWIPTIFQFGGKSPIILGQTCHDGNSTNWNDVGAYIANENFNIIKDHEQNYHEINLPNNNNGLTQIKKSIVNQILNLPHYKKRVPTSWIKVRELISDLKFHNCISYVDLKGRIQKSNPESFVTKEDVEYCVKFFHSIGVLLWYHNEAKLKEWVILNPKWTVDAVYKIIDDEKILNQKGIILSMDFERVWHDKIYDDKHNILKYMLEVFKIAFPKKHNKADYIIPTRLQSIPAGNIWNNSESYLQIEYRYDFMPKGMVNQISAELSRYIPADDQVWNNCVNFSDGKTISQVFEDFYHRKIIVKAKGQDARSFIMIIMNAVRDITDGYKGVKPQIIIPCTCEDCSSQDEPTSFVYEKLIKKIERDEAAIVTCNISDIKFKIEKLLFKIGLPNPIKEKKDLENIKHTENKNIKRLFISYSNEDYHYKETLEKNLKPISEFEVLKSWSCEEMTSGDWHDQIQAQLEVADIVVFMMSLSFVNSDYILQEEVFKTFEAIKSNKNKKIICVLVKNFPWTSFAKLKSLTNLSDDDFKKLKNANTLVELTSNQFIPYYIENKGKQDSKRYLLPINKWEHEEDAFVEVVKQITQVLEFE